MALKDIVIKQEYRSFHDDIVKDFYIPILKQSVIYKRAVGYFSSNVLNQIADGIVALANNNGNIQLVASPFLSDDELKL